MHLFVNNKLNRISFWYIRFEVVLSKAFNAMLIRNEVMMNGDQTNRMKASEEPFLDRTAQRCLDYHEEGTVDHRTQLGEDLLHLLTKGSSNDVKIILDDGEIYVNKDILGIRSDYFSTINVQQHSVY